MSEEQINYGAPTPETVQARNDQLNEELQRLRAEKEKDVQAVVDCMSLSNELAERDAAKIKEAIAQRDQALAVARELGEHYANAETLAVPEDWDYPGMGGGPDVDQLERTDIGGPARDALAKLAALARTEGQRQ